MKEENRRSFGIEIPEEIARKLDDTAEIHKVSRSKILTWLLAKAFSMDKYLPQSWRDKE